MRSSRREYARRIGEAGRFPESYIWILRQCGSAVGLGSTGSDRNSISRRDYSGRQKLRQTRYGVLRQVIHDDNLPSFPQSRGGSGGETERRSGVAVNSNNGPFDGMRLLVREDRAALIHGGVFRGDSCSLAYFLREGGVHHRIDKYRGDACARSHIDPVNCPVERSVALM